MENYKDWLLRAKSNLLYAKAKVSEDILYVDKCFQAQQAVEKAFKGLLIYFGVNYPFTHNIKTLLDILYDYVPLPNHIKQAVILTDYATFLRYPSTKGDVPKEVYEQAIQVADDCLDWVEYTIAEEKGEKG